MIKNICNQWAYDKIHSSLTEMNEEVDEILKDFDQLPTMVQIECIPINTQAYLIKQQLRKLIYYIEHNINVTPDEFVINEERDDDV